MIYSIDLLSNPLDWMLSALQEQVALIEGSDDEGYYELCVETKALLGLVVSLCPDYLDQHEEKAKHLALFMLKNQSTLAQVAACNLSEKEWLEEVALLKEGFERFKELAPKVEDRMGEILDLQYQLADRLLVLTFATIYDGQLTGGIEGERGAELRKLMYWLLKEDVISSMKDASMSIAHLNIILIDLEHERCSRLQEGVQYFTWEVKYRNL